MDEISIRVNDVKDVNDILAALLNFHQARDLMEAQVKFTMNRYSPLTNEIARVKHRVEGYLGDYALEHLDLDEPTSAKDTDYDAQDSENGFESLTEAFDEPLSDAPIKAPKVQKRTGRRLSGEEITRGTERS